MDQTPKKKGDKEKPEGPFSKMLRAKNPTERTLMMGLKLAYRSIQDREFFPEKLTIEELFRVSALLNIPLDEVINTVVGEVHQSGRMPTVRINSERQEA
ncbi:hypothetical protein [Hymenobacter defluvii]|uniref:HTH cro/C1-type domain-containing protein n=1 Tax=Hymenobacter defluvii TaxID=2054411 RepID=A0ABS3THH4_9BACT|nr:hypothetical protein [Hymenobacter defluvii]MBO3272039.1 hypothetical protein [Hymenobacter defluvii]